LTAEPIMVIPEVQQGGVFLIVTFVTSEGTEVVMDCGKGGESGGLVRVIFGSAPNEISDSDGFI
jgi:hypothetical protein